MDRSRHSGAGAVPSGDLPVDPDDMDQLSPDARHVRNGPDDETVRLRGGVQEPEGRHGRLPCAVHRNAAAGVRTRKGFRSERGAAGRRRSRGDLSGRNVQQCHHVSVGGRHGAVRGHDQRQYVAGPVSYARAHLSLSADLRKCGRQVYVPVHRSGRHLSDRTGAFDQ